MRDRASTKDLAQPAGWAGRIRRLTLGMVLCCFAGFAAAHTSELDQLIQVLIDKGLISVEEVADLRSEAAQARVQEKVKLIASELGYEPTALLADDDAATQVRRLGIESADGRDRFRIRGRMQFDVARQNFGDDIQNVARQGHAFPDDGIILRRLRLGALGLWREHWEWQLEVDFAENEVDLANAYMAYLMPHGRLAIGHFKEPFGMEYATSSRYISFIERSAASDAYKVNREPGIMYETLQPNWYLGVGAFGHGIDYDREVREGWALSARSSFAPYLSDNGFVHVGAGVNKRRNAYNNSEDEWEEVRLRTREGTRVIDARLIGRDDLVAVRDFTRYNVEFAAGFGPWWVQSEYLMVDIDLDRDRLLDELGGNATDKSSLTQDGWYIQSGFFLTGESKNYRAFSGDFGRQTPINNFARGEGWGAFEVLARYSVADSLEHTRVGRGQKLEHWTLGLNWYVMPEVVMKLNVIYLEGERDNFKDDGWVYGYRFQYDF